MKANRMKSVLSCFAILMAGYLICGLGTPAWAEDTDTLLKQVNKELRQAERDMFSGKTDEAVAAIKNAEKLLIQIKAADPDNTRVKTAEKKYSKLVKDLERRTGKDLGGGTLTAAESGTETEATTDATTKTEKTTVGKVPHAARRPLSKATTRLDAVDRNLDDLADPDYRGDKDRLAENIEAKLVEIRKSLDEAKTLAAENGVTSHPDFDQAEAKLADARKKVVEAKAGYEKDKAAAAAKAEEVNADVKALRSEYDGVRSVFDKAMGVAIYYNDLEPVEKLISQIEDFEKNDLAKIKAKTEAFGKKYGTTEEEIDEKAEFMGYSGQGRASYAYTELVEGIEAVKKTRVAMAEDLMKKADRMLADLKGVHDLHVIEQSKVIKTWYEMAARYDADSPKVKEARSTVDKRIADITKEFHAAIDKRTWSEHAANAPENADELAEAALEWFKSDIGWGRRDENPRAKDKESRRPLAVVVTGPWSIQKKNIRDEPIMYGLPILLAVEVESDKDLNVARVYSMTIRTQEKRGVKMAPPFDHVTVGDSYLIRPSAVK